MEKKRKKHCKILLFLTIVGIFFFYLASYSTPVEATQTKKGNFSKSYTLTGNGAKDIVAVAKAQEGKTQAQLGYTESWCADFVSDCADLAGQGTAVKRHGAVSSLLTNVKYAGGEVVTSLKTGDLVFYYCNSCKAYKHVSIAVDSSNVIHGNFWYNPNSSSSYSHVQTYKLGVYIDSNNHSVSSGQISQIYVRPNYTGTAVKQLSSISISTAASKSQYWKYEQPNTNGLILKVTYSDNSTKTITSGYKATFDATEVGTRPINIVSVK